MPDIRLVSATMACRAAFRFVALLTLATGIYVAGSSLVMIVTCWTPLPLTDSWGELISGRTITWTWLTSLGNEHRILISRLVAIADYWLAAERDIVQFVVGGLIIATTGLLLLFISGEIRRGWAATAWMAGLTLALLCWSVQYEALTWGLPFVQFWGVLLAAVAALSILGLRPPTLANLALVIACEIVGAYTMAAGAVAPFITLMLAIWFGRPRSHIALLALAAFLLFGSQVIDLYHHPANTGGMAKLTNAGAVLGYAAAYLGGPFGAGVATRFAVPPLKIAIIFGTGGILAFTIAGSWMLLHRDRASARQAVLFAITAFIVADAFLTAIGRTSLGVGQALASRYSTHAVLFWASMALLAFSSRTPARRLAVMVLCLPALFLIAESQPRFVAIAQARAGQQRAAIPALLAGVSDPVLGNILFYDPELALKLRQPLQNAHTSIYSDAWAGWLGTPLANHVAVVDPHLCGGTFVEMLKEASATFPGWRATGNAWSAANREPASRIVLADAEGIVRGYGLGGFPAAALDMVATTGPKDVSWIGAVTGSDPATIKAYALLESGACSLDVTRKTGQMTTLQFSPVPSGELPPGGAVDDVIITTDRIFVSGWGLLRQENARLVIETNLPIKASNFSFMSRPDVASALGDPRLVSSGIFVTLVLNPDSPLPGQPHLCVWTDDPVFGRHLLSIPSRPAFCAAPGK